MNTFRSQIQNYAFQGFLLVTILVFGCKEHKPGDHPINSSDSIKNDNTVVTKSKTDTLPSAKTYSNKRFKDVTIERTGDHTFQVKGKAQVFEATFSWVIEDGHNELQKGSQMTSAGAPEWGEFVFSVNTKKERPNSTLTLILFEASPKDGSRQYELPIRLY